MSRKIITQPLPQDIRNWSFRGMECVGWDFSGRDIRGCDFRNAKLNGANFSWAIAGKTKRQTIYQVIAMIFSSATFLVVGAVAVASQNIVLFIAAFPVALGVSITLGIADIFMSGLGFVFLLLFVPFALLALLVIVSGQIFTVLGIVLTVPGILVLVLLIMTGRDMIRAFKKTPGTNFYGADLQSVDFSHAILNDCEFEFFYNPNFDFEKI